MSFGAEVILYLIIISKVMYMYYFLGYKLWSQEYNLRRLQDKADNTFLLALDGDVDFEPKAMLLLVDLLRKDEKVGAACGRIHPTGAGMLINNFRVQKVLHSDAKHETLLFNCHLRHGLVLYCN